jgi:hypothetical protein
MVPGVVVRARARGTRSRASAALLAGALGLFGCATERPPDDLVGQLFRLGPRYRVTACGTDDSFELRLATALQVNLDRRVAQVVADRPPAILVQLAGRSLPPTRDSAPTKIFEVWKIGSVEPGGCTRP